MTSNELATQSGGDLVGTGQDRGVHRAGAVSFYTPEERDTLRALGGLDEASDGDLHMLKVVSETAGLDPFAKQIYLVGRKTKTGGYRGEPERWETKWTVQVGIDGFRAVTHRYAEQKRARVEIGRPIFYDAEGQQQKIWLKKWGHPEAVEVTVTVGDSSATGMATWDEYVQTKRDGNPNQMWSTMGPTMLAKCAEAQAHRRVCPLTAGMYEPAEIRDEPRRVESTREAAPSRGVAGVRERLGIEQSQQPPVDVTADLVKEEPEKAPAAAPASAGERNDMLAILASVGHSTQDEVLGYVSEVLGRTVTGTKELTSDEVADVSQRVLAETEPPAGDL